jgi:hypothetical protein
MRTVTTWIDSLDRLLAGGFVSSGVNVIIAPEDLAVKMYRNLQRSYERMGVYDQLVAISREIAGSKVPRDHRAIEPNALHAIASNACTVDEAAVIFVPVRIRPIIASKEAAMREVRPHFFEVASCVLLVTQRYYLGIDSQNQTYTTPETDFLVLKHRRFSQIEYGRAQVDGIPWAEPDPYYEPKTYTRPG